MQNIQPLTLSAGLRKCLAAALTLALGSTAVAAPASMYDSGIEVTRSDGQRVGLASMKGRPALMTMFFASCGGVCPLMTEQIRRVEKGLTPAERARLQVLLVSFDEGDTLERLGAYGRAHAADPSRWVIAKGSTDVNRTLAGLLGIRFQKLPNGSFSHNSVLDLVDADGVVLAQLPGTSLDDPRFAVAVKQLLASSQRKQ